MSDPEDLRRALATLWPVLEEEEEAVDESVSFEAVETAYWDFAKRVALENAKGDQVGTVKRRDFTGAVERFTEKRYRLLGWLLLFTGFSLQFVGTVL